MPLLVNRIHKLGHDFYRVSDCSFEQKPKQLMEYTLKKNIPMSISKKRLEEIIDEYRTAFHIVKDLVDDEMCEFNDNPPSDSECYDNGILFGRNEMAEMLFKKIQSLEIKYNL